MTVRIINASKTACARTYLGGSSDERPRVGSLPEALLAGGEELRWDVVAHAGIFEFVNGRMVLRQGFYVADDAPKLAAASALLLVQVVEVGARLDGFPEVDLWLPHLAVDLQSNGYGRSKVRQGLSSCSNTYVKPQA